MFSIYIVLCVALYSYQERMIFFLEKLLTDHEFAYAEIFEELSFETKNNKNLNGFLFASDSTRGLIFDILGNAGSLNLWGNVVETYTELNHDVFILDYRGFGKNVGSIKSQNQLYAEN